MEQVTKLAYFNGKDLVKVSYVAEYSAQHTNSYVDKDSIQYAKINTMQTYIT